MYPYSYYITFIHLYSVIFYVNHSCAILKIQLSKKKKGSFETLDSSQILLRRSIPWGFQVTPRLSTSQNAYYQVHLMTSDSCHLGHCLREEGTDRNKWRAGIIRADFSRSGLLNPRAFINIKTDAIWGEPILQMEGKRKIRCLVLYEVLVFFPSKWTSHVFSLLSPQPEHVSVLIP